MAASILEDTMGVSASTAVGAISAAAGFGKGRTDATARQEGQRRYVDEEEALPRRIGHEERAFMAP